MNIIIRKAIPGDEKGVAYYVRESMRKGFFRFTGSNKPPTKKKMVRMRKDYTSKNRNEYKIVAVDTINKKIVGSAGFTGAETGRIRHRVDLGWSVSHIYAGQGIGTLLVKELIREANKRGIKRLEAESAVENIASIKLATKFGFKIEGIKKYGLLLDNGKYVDTYMFGKILR